MLETIVTLLVFVALTYVGQAICGVVKAVFCGK